MRLRGQRLRTEQKYYLHLHDYIAMRSRISTALQLDEHSITSDGYNIRSLYFDDAKRTAIETKNDGVFKRQKFRIRTYNDSDSYISIERKSKIGEFVAKEAVQITREQYDGIIDGNYEFLYQSKEPLCRDFYVALQTYGYRPTTIVDYWREAYVYSYGNVRITFDKRLAVGSNSTNLFEPQLSHAEVLSPAVTIMEVKYDDVLPDNIRQLLRPTSHNRSSISKYVLCREKMMHLHTQ
ncbi:polyphosphate polymerase domain-containing protein [Paenibacillus endoradicis]|uniref:polyphosphate polymerase domain-containing protein n=1 Tax=Paenibacillus endoradicis TaxID=2972487 RepID=UPI0021599024|nr:polyphosphate polymerase domain-containing protein [Paenibacillus endoradicis]MCR8657586.1 polyphosphate polymerase domain-containing protein [Paenibacillus endoradicis]